MSASDASASATAQSQQPGTGAAARATALARAVARAMAPREADSVDFSDGATFARAGNTIFEYQPARDLLSLDRQIDEGGFQDPTPAEQIALARANRANNDPTIGGHFERGGGYYVFDRKVKKGYLVHDYPVATIGSGRLREGATYHRYVSSAWDFRLGGDVGSIAHGRDTSPAGLVAWDDRPFDPFGETPTHPALDAVPPDTATGRARAEAVVQGYLAHRLEPAGRLGRADVAARALGDVPDVYDGGDFYLRYRPGATPAADELEAGVFVATPADLARLARGGVPPDRLAAALALPPNAAVGTPMGRGPFGAGFAAPVPLPRDAATPGPAPTATALVLHAPPGAAAGAPPLLYLTQRYRVADLTPRRLLLAMEPLLDYGTVWRHRWLWRAARVVLRAEAPPAHVVVRTPDDYGPAPAAERLDVAPPRPAVPPELEPRAYRPHGSTPPQAPAPGAPGARPQS